MIPAVRRVESNDRTLTHLLVCEPPTVVRGEGRPHFGMAYMSEDLSSLKALCDSIGINEHLEDVCFDAPLGLADLVSSSTCFEGLRRNASIRSLGLSRCDLSRGVGREVLRAVEENPEHLTEFAIWRCGMRLGGSSNLASALINCRHLRDISLSSCSLDDASVRDIVAAVRGHHQLKNIDLSENDIGRDGCEAISSLLHKPNCNRLRIVDLSNNRIDDEGAKFIADGLRKNDTVEAISLDENSILAKGWNTISDALCDMSTLNATHSSNHTLCMVASYGHVSIAGGGLYDEDDVMPRNLLRLIELNGSGRGKNDVARQKVLLSHFVDAFSMKPFLDENMNWKVLPHVINWIGQSCNEASCTAMLNLLREMPVLCAIAGTAGSSALKKLPQMTTIKKNHLPAHWGRRLVSATQKSRLGIIICKTPGCPRAIKVFRKRKHLFRAQQGDGN